MAGTTPKSASEASANLVYEFPGTEQHPASDANPFFVYDSSPAQAQPATAPDRQCVVIGGKGVFLDRAPDPEDDERQQPPFDISAPSQGSISGNCDLETQLARLVAGEDYPLTPSKPTKRDWRDKALLAAVEQHHALGLTFSINVAVGENPTNTLSNFQGYIRRFVKKLNDKHVDPLVFAVWVDFVNTKRQHHPHVHGLIECEPGDPVYLAVLAYARTRKKRRHAAAGPPVRVKPPYDALGWLQYLRGPENACKARLEADPPLARVYASQSLRQIGNELSEAEMDALEQRLMAHVRLPRHT